jgi:plasmid maintenance system antidote protein VapI
MEEKLNQVLDQRSAQRFREFLTFLELTPLGMAAFLDLSSDHIYSLLRGRRSISDAIADSISEKLGITTADVYNSNFKLRKTKKGIQHMNQFIHANRNNPNFFINLKNENSLTFKIRIELVENGFFNSEKQVSKVVEELAKLQIKVISGKATKSLLYLVETGYLTFQKKPFIKKDGTESKLPINHYIEP